MLAARDLEKDGLWGKADPYVLLKLGEQRAKSGTVGNTQDPVWNFTAQLQVCLYTVHCTLLCVQCTVYSVHYPLQCIWTMDMGQIASSQIASYEAILLVAI